MADQTQFQAVISVIDRATSPIRRIAASMGGLGAKTGGWLKAAGQATGVPRLLGAVGSAAGQARDAVGEMVGPLAAIGGAGAVTGLVALAKNFADVGGAIDDASKRTGVAAGRLQELRYAAQMSGVEAETMDRSLAGLNKRIAEAASGKNAELGALFRRLNIPLKDAGGHLRSASDLLPDVAEAMRINTNEVQRAAMATALFGDEGTRLIGLLSDGRDGLTKFADEARQLGIVMSDEEVADAAAFGDEMDRLALAGKGLSLTLGGRLVPVIRPLITSMTGWISANREMLGLKLGEAIQAIAEAFRTIDIGSLVTSGAALVAGFARVVGTISQVKGGLVALLPAMIAINAAMTANPVGLVVAGLAALSAAAILVVQNWDSVGPALARAFAGIIQAGQGLMDMMSGLGEMIVGVFTLDFGKALAGAKQMFGGFFDYVAGLAQQLWDTVKGLIDGIAWAGRKLGLLDDETEEGGEAEPSAAQPDTPAQPLAPPPQGGLLAQAQAAGVSGVGAAPPAKVEGEVVTRVEITGAPPGTRVTTEARGVAAPEVDVGYRGNRAFGGA